MYLIDPIGDIIAAVPAQKISSAFITSSILIFLSSTFISSLFLAKNKTESLVIPGKIEPVSFGVTNLFPNIAKKFAAPTSSMYFSSAASRYMTSAYPCFFAIPLGSIPGT